MIAAKGRDRASWPRSIDRGMSEPSLPLPSDETADDLPRTFRRERDARAKEAREREEREQREAEARKARGERVSPFAAPDAPSATITGFDVPFTHLVMFFLKAAIAAVPALLLLGAMLLLIGTLIALFDPGLVPIQLKFGYK